MIKTAYTNHKQSIGEGDFMDYRDDPKTKELAKSVVRATKDAIRIAQGEDLGEDASLLIDELRRMAEELKNEN